MTSSLGDHLGLDKFLTQSREMTIIPNPGEDTILSGVFNFKSRPIPDSGKVFPEIIDSYRIRIIVPVDFPHSLPTVYELGGRITKETSNGHLYPNQSLCLSSRFGQFNRLLSNPDSGIIFFVEEFLIPYLYSISYKEKNGGDLIFGELAHDNSGILDDIGRIFSLNERQALNALPFLVAKKRIANKKQCPCDCGSRFGVCDFRKKLMEFRGKFTRPVLNREMQILARQLYPHLNRPLRKKYRAFFQNMENQQAIDKNIISKKLKHESHESQ